MTDRENWEEKNISKIALALFEARLLAKTANPEDIKNILRKFIKR